VELLDVSDPSVFSPNVQNVFSLVVVVSVVQNVFSLVVVSVVRVGVLFFSNICGFR
jgi:hypothetical protein